MNDWREPRELPANRELLSWLQMEAEPARHGGIEFGGYELRAHPDLVDRLVESVQDLEVELIAAFGVPCISRPDGKIVAFARGTHHVYIRGLGSESAIQPAELQEQWGGIDAFFPVEWRDMSLDQRLLRKEEDQQTLLARVRSLIAEAAAEP